MASYFCLVFVALRLLFGLADKRNKGKLTEQQVHKVLVTLWLPVSTLPQCFPLVDTDSKSFPYFLDSTVVSLPFYWILNNNSNSSNNYNVAGCK